MFAPIQVVDGFGTLRSPQPTTRGNCRKISSVNTSYRSRSSARSTTFEIVAACPQCRRSKSQLTPLAGLPAGAVQCAPTRVRHFRCRRSRGRSAVLSRYYSLTSLPCSVADWEIWTNFHASGRGGGSPRRCAPIGCDIRLCLLSQRDTSCGASDRGGSTEDRCYAFAAGDQQGDIRLCPVR